MPAYLQDIDSLDAAGCLAYSRMKLGCTECLNSYANELANMVKDRLLGHAPKSKVPVVVCPGTGHLEVPNSITFLSRQVAEKLDAKQCVLLKEDAFGHSHEDAPANQRDILRTMLIPKDASTVLHDRQIVLVDDCVAGGSTLAKSRTVLAPHVFALATFVLLKLHGRDPTAEADVNRTAIKTNGADVLVELWADSKNFSTSKLTKYTFEGKSSEVVSSLPPIGALNLYLASLLYYYRLGMSSGFDEVVKAAQVSGLRVPDKSTLANALESDPKQTPARSTAFRSWLHGRLSQRPTFRVAEPEAPKMVDDLNRMVRCLETMPKV